jgi:hypothetical protein
MAIEKQQVTAMSVSIGDWIEYSMGKAIQVLDIGRTKNGKILFMFVHNATMEREDHGIVDLLIAV